MSIETIPISSGANVHTTTKRREWWGWFGSMAWLAFMMYGHDIFILPDLMNGEAVSNDPLFFIIIFAIAIIVFGFHFGKNPNGLSRIAFYTTPVAIIITALFTLLPSPFSSILYVISPIFIAPSLVRRVFGVLHTAETDKRLTSYVSANAVFLIAYSVWLTIGLQKEFAFLIPALLAIPAWLYIRRTIIFSDEPSVVSSFKYSKQLLFVFMGAIILLFWLGTMNAVIYTHILATGMETLDTVISLLGVILPGASILLYAMFSDKGYERTGLVISMMIFISGILIALMSIDTQAPWLIPLTVANSLGGSYFEFLFLTIPLYFLANSKRPVFVASLGVVVELIFAALLWRMDFWLPKSLQRFGTPVLFSAAFSAVIFVILISFLFERYREKTLAATLFALLHSNNIGIPQPVDTETPDTPKPLNIMDELFTAAEMKIAILLIEGETQRNISRNLHLSTAEVVQHVNAIRDKVNHMGSLDPVVTAVAKEYRLTRRETDMLRRLRQSMTNAEIAADLFLSEETVRIHIRNLLKKLPVESRQDVAVWVEAFGENKE